MITLSDKLADLSVRIGDVEARAYAFCFDTAEKRDQKIMEMQATVRALQDSLQSSVQGKDDEISSVWAELGQAQSTNVARVRAKAKSKKDVTGTVHARRRAESLGTNASLAIDFAIIAMLYAELAVAEALDARVHAGEHCQRKLA